ncbi:murein biosynthesis integral membrane protein MurJ [Priestia megaterium]|uniref:murein biosynthesis integral membrane protein MurJ n=1 Tax=Priestia megaterium TaxID=1404 RepID=UPI00234E5B3D|nr:murein biosynthesis integral membrane protein MurJ [Priestia megaterium]MDC7783895.1 murein biosynthesis integral membrane protein MurJ [Priestia megaterium]
MSNKIASTAILITCITLFSKIFGFFRDIILAATYGTTFKADAFIMAQSIIEVITGVVIAALGTTFIPVMSDYLNTKSKEETNKFLNVIYNVSISVTLIICILGMIFTKELISIFAPSFSSEVQKLTIQLTRIILPSIILMVLVTLNNAKLQNHGNFIIPTAIGFPQNIVLIVAMIFLTDSYGIYGLAFAALLGVLFQVLLQLPFTRKLSYHYKFDFDLKEEGLRRIGILIIPILIGSGVQQINWIVDRMLASGLPEGSIAALNYSNRLNAFVIGLLSATVTTIFYTSMSNYYSQGKDKEFKKMLRKTINILIILIVPASIGFFVLRLPIVKQIFLRGSFDIHAAEMTAYALYFTTLGMIGFSLREVISRAFYAIKDTKTAMINGSIAVVINIIASILLVPYLGLGGLVLATSISAIVGTILLMISLHKRVGNYGYKNIIITFIKVLFVSVLMGITVDFCYKIIYNVTSINTIALLLSIIVGMLIYTLLIMLLKIEEVSQLKQLLIIRLERLLKKSTN